MGATEFRKKKETLKRHSSVTSVSQRARGEGGREKKHDCRVDALNYSL